MPDESSNSTATFTNPPVVETRLSVQFRPLLGFRAAHFGAFWRDCLGAGWRPVNDTEPQNRSAERFDTLELNPVGPDDSQWMNESTALQAVFRSADERDTVLFQPDRLTYRVQRGKADRTYRDLRAAFDPIMARLAELAAANGFNTLEPDYWELQYLNAVPRGGLWQEPADWAGVFPGLFAPGKPSLSVARWTTYEGEWHFELPERAGRLRLSTRKAVSNRTSQVTLLLIVRASGPDGALGWADGLDTGHDACVTAFREISSDAALTSWGYSRAEV